jgi:hypothetical protein
MRSATRVFLVTSLLAANCIFEWPYALRFSSNIANYIVAGLIAFTLALSFFLYCLSIRKKWLKVFALGVSGIGIALCAILVPTIFIFDGAFSTSRSPALDLQDTLRIENVSYRLYLDQGGGAFSPPFTILREERDLPLGAKLVKTIGSSGKYGNSKLHQISSSEIEMAIDEDFFRQRFKIK